MLAALAVALYGTGWVEGLRHQQARDNLATSRQAVRVVKIVEKQSAISQQVAQATTQQKERVRYVYREVVKQIPVYLGESSDSKCHLTLGWVRLYNSAVMSTLPGAPTESDATPSTVTATQVLSNAAGNYRTCNEVRRELIGLQTWAKRIRSSSGN